MIASNPAKFRCLAPVSLAEAVQQKAEVPGLMPLAGGTEIMVLVNEGLIPPTPVQSLHKLETEWRYIRENSAGELAIGPLATYTDLRHHPIVRERYPLLVEAARVTGSLQIQNRGTLGGNIVNGSPAADSVPALMVYDAQLRLLSVRSERVVPINGFYTGYRKTLLQPEEILAEIVLPQRGSSSGTLHYYRKVGTRAAQAISKIVVAGLWESGSAPRLAWGSVGPVTLRTPRTEAALADGSSAEEACGILLNEMTPIDDIRSTALYRQQVSCNLLKQFQQLRPD